MNVLPVKINGNAFTFVPWIIDVYYDTCAFFKACFRVKKSELWETATLINIINMEIVFYSIKRVYISKDFSHLSRLGDLELSIWNWTKIL